MQEGQFIAAVDLGSNSFRMEIGRLDHGRIVRVDYLKETVRQGAGLDEQRNLTLDAMERGWAALSRFGERLSGFSGAQVRAVATQTLREARNREQFLKKAQTLLGFPIEVIAGREEARLIYQGVAQYLGGEHEKRLVMDIGGRSTELITGQGLESAQLESYRVGSVAWADKYFAHGQLDAANMSKAIVAAKAVLDEAVSHFSQDWQTVYGCAGTVGAIADILYAQGVQPGFPEGHIDRTGLQWLRKQVERAGHVDKLEMPGLKEDRKPVLAGGLAILWAIFDLLDLKQIRSVDAGLRHGVLYDLLGRDSVATDIRSQSIERIANRFGVDAQQAEYVEQAAQLLMSQIQTGLSETQEQRQRQMRKLRWAAQLHEVGALISHSDCHKHSAYIIDNADIEGFSTNELHRLSLLVLGHKGKLGKLQKEHTVFTEVSFMQQLICLRLAVLLCHARVEPSLKGLQLAYEASRTQFSLNLPAGWAEQFPQSMHLLQQEIAAWNKTDWCLEVVG